jgi:hypothetical protein
MKALRNANPVLTQDDLLWLYAETRRAFSRVEDIGRKQPAEIDGEIFTTMRRAAAESGVSRAISGLFRGRKKHFAWRLDAKISPKERSIIIAMYDQLRRRSLAEPQVPLDTNNLELILLALRADVREAEQIASESEKVRQGLDGIQAILDGKDEGDDHVG